MSLRVAFYSHNGFGLGHFRRNLILAQALLRRKPSADVLIITGSSGLNEFPLPLNVDCVKLPAVRKQAAGRWRPLALDIEMEHLLQLRRTIILESVRAYRPHLFVADFLPLGVEEELRPALEELRDRPDARSAIGFRDVLDEPQAIREAWAAEDIPTVLRELYDRVLVYGAADWFDFSQYGVKGEDLTYVGLLGRAGMPKPRPPGSIRLLATSGGGADGYPVLATTLDAIDLLHDQIGGKLTCTILTGPLMPESDVERLRAVGKRVGARIHRFAEDFPGKLARSSIVIGMCGYNTVCDVLSYRRPALFVPRPGPSREQPIRSRILADRGLSLTLPLAECTAHAMADALVSLLEDRPYPEEALPELGGVDRSVQELLSLVA
ncbi:MAG TPA: glycosyltransferase [Actinomycetota bacterium]|nr:glycosyltransferase [Actinomycetota bacterium]